MTKEKQLNNNGNKFADINNKTNKLLLKSNFNTDAVVVKFTSTRTSLAYSTITFTQGGYYPKKPSGENTCVITININIKIIINIISILSNA